MATAQVLRHQALPLTSHGMATNASCEIRLGLQVARMLSHQLCKSELAQEVARVLSHKLHKPELAQASMCRTPRQQVLQDSGLRRLLSKESKLAKSGGLQHHAQLLLPCAG
mmetsp:Transcript_76022/g.137223  ORF Transcript_76022/g.137223 Transcript_76022/m.137223 type:complete len:111 (+) Transcript_76022:395-727(+)